MEPTDPIERDETPDAPASEDRFQSQLWFLVGSLVLVVGYLIAFVIANSEQVKISFVFYSARTSLIWLIVLSVVIGLVGGIVLSQLFRNRSR